MILFLFIFHYAQADLLKDDASFLTPDVKIAIEELLSSHESSTREKIVVQINERTPALPKQKEKEDLPESQPSDEDQTGQAIDTTRELRIHIGIQDREVLSQSNFSFDSAHPNMQIYGLLIEPVQKSFSSKELFSMMLLRSLFDVLQVLESPVLLDQTRTQNIQKLIEHAPKNLSLTFSTLIKNILWVVCILLGIMLLVFQLYWITAALLIFSDEEIIRLRPRLFSNKKKETLDLGGTFGSW